MREKIDFATNEDWLKERVKWLTATDTAAIAGASNPKYNSAHRVWRLKTGREQFKGNKFTERGKRFEAVVLDIYLEELRKRAGDSKYVEMIRNPKNSMHVVHGTRSAATTDATVYINGVVHELVDAKTTISRVHKKWLGELPNEYYVQGIMQCYCTGVDRVTFPVLVLDDYDLHEYTVTANDELAEELASNARAWYERHIVEGVEPEIERAEDAQTVVPIAKTVVKAQQEQTWLVSNALKYREKKDYWEAKETAAKDEIRVLLAHAEALANEDGTEALATYKTQERTTAVADNVRMAQRLLREIAERVEDKETKNKIEIIASDCFATNTTRVLLLKKPKVKKQ